MRVYVDGFDMSGYSRSIGPLQTKFAVTLDAALSDAVMNVQAGLGNVDMACGTLNGFYDNTATSGMHAVMGAGNGTVRDVMIPIGIRADPAMTDPVFCIRPVQVDYMTNLAADGQTTTVTVGFNGWDTNQVLWYRRAWGSLAHAKGAETAVNSAVGYDDSPAGAQTTKGGWMMYHLFTSDGTVTLKMQDNSVNVDGSFADLSGATSGSIDGSSSPKHGIVQLATTATVRQYLRWQLVKGTCTTATFALAFMRGN
jgi:hypothetical protein